MYMHYTKIRVPTVLPKPNSPTFPVNQTTFPDLYRHTVPFSSAQIISACGFCNLKEFCTWIFNFVFIHALHMLFAVRQNIKYSFDYWHICNSPLFWLFTFCLTYPGQWNSMTFSSFSWPVGTLKNGTANNGSFVCNLPSSNGVMTNCSTFGLEFSVTSHAPASPVIRWLTCGDDIRSPITGKDM